MDLTKEHEDIKSKEEENRIRIKKHDLFWDKLTKDMENAIFNHMEDLVGESMRGDYPNFKLSIYPPSIKDGIIDVNLLGVLVLIRKGGGFIGTVVPEYSIVYHVKENLLEIPRKNKCFWRVSYSTKQTTLRKALAEVISPERAKSFKESRKRIEELGDLNNV